MISVKKLSLLFIIVLLLSFIIIDVSNSESLINIDAKPSCGCNNNYVWTSSTFVNHCPNCNSYDCLLDNPKGVYEHELTCKYCDSDFCAVCGKEKYDWSKVYLNKVYYD